MPEAEGRADLVGRWLAKADGDLAIARLALNDGGIEPWIIGFHAQQAVEKRSKAVIAGTGVEPPTRTTS